MVFFLGLTIMKNVILILMGSGLYSKVVTKVKFCCVQVIIIHWNLGIRDTQGTVKQCPEF